MWNGRLWLALATRPSITVSVLPIYSYSTPLIVDRAALPPNVAKIWGVSGRPYRAPRPVHVARARSVRQADPGVIVDLIRRRAPTLAGAMSTSIFNLGTTVGRAITAAALQPASVYPCKPMNSPDSPSGVRIWSLQRA